MPPRASPRKRKAISYNEDHSDDDAEVKPTKKKAIGRKRKAEPESEPDLDESPSSPPPPAKPKAAAPKKRKTKAASKKDEDMPPLAARTSISSLKKAMYIGAHVSAAGGVHNSVVNAVHIGANAFALFLKSQRKWASPPLDPEAKTQFVSRCSHHGYSTGEHALPHGSYLVNLAQADAAKGEQAYASFLDDLKRCEALEIKLYNFHPGNTGGEPREEAIGRIAARLNRAHGETESVVTVLENMAGGGNVVGSTWEDLRDIIALVDDKARVGVCIDTCHAFAAGYDLRTPDKFKVTIESFNKIVGDKYLKAFHCKPLSFPCTHYRPLTLPVNDSKAPFASNRDLHANIGTGFLGLRAFHSLVNHAPFQGKPMVLETPTDRPDPKTGKSVEDRQVWADEIKLLERLVGMDPDGDEFIGLEEELGERGAAERDKIQEQVERKAVKQAKKGTGKGRGAGRKKKVKDETEESE